MAQAKEGDTMQAKEGNSVKVHYTGRLEDGTVFDSSEGREPLEFTLGEGMVIPGFDEAVLGMNPGDSKTVNIPSDEAYGPHRDEMVMVVDKDEFPDDLNPQVEDVLQVQDPDGEAFMVRVTAVDDETITLDANHPLAGKNLIFDIRLEEIK